MRKVDGKVSNTKSKQLVRDIEELAPHVKLVLPVFLQAQQSRREALLGQNPVLAAFVALLEECGVSLPVTPGMPGE